jgi:hypothetical protein
MTFANRGGDAVCKQGDICFLALKHNISGLNIGFYVVHVQTREDLNQLAHWQLVMAAHVDASE